jgi:Flp pilus assembly protein TadB
MVLALLCTFTIIAIAQAFMFIYQWITKKNSAKSSISDETSEKAKNLALEQSNS